MQLNNLAEVRDFDIEECINHLEMLHKDSKGYITISSKDPNYKQWHYKSEDIIDNAEDILNIINAYVSQNTFYKPQRRIENIKELRTIYIDIDCHKTKYSKEAVKYFLEKDFYGTKIPQPNFLIDSGRGLYYVLLIEPVPSMAMPLWYAVQRYIYNQLKEFGADRKALDATRILRVPGSINSKSGTRVSILEKHEYKYTLREIQNEFLPDLDENRNKKKGRPKKVVYIHRERSLYQNRILDIVKLCELRNYDVKGHREIILFLYRYYLCYFYEDEQRALEDVLELNKEFIHPLGEKELIRATGSAEKVFKSKDKQYKYKNETLIDILEISDYEQTHMKIIIGKEEYKRRHRIREKNRYVEKLKSQGSVSEKEKISQRRQKIKALLAEGLLQKDICNSLNISKDTYIRDRKFLKEQGLI